MKRRNVLGSFAAAVLVLAVGAEPSAAVDGVIEINQARAALGAVSPADAPGYPVTIDTAGSYRLTGPMTVVLDDADAIVITASGVSIDLNGFTISGPGGGMGTAIRADAPRTRVRNGTVTAFGSDGIRLGALSAVESVHAIQNGGDGIQVGALGVVRNCVAAGNGEAGIRADTDLRLESSLASLNTGEGVFAKQRALVVDSTASTNGANGFNLFDYSIIENCQAAGNMLDGVLAGTGSRVAKTVASENGDDGICILGKCTLLGNTAVDNHGHGIDMLPDCAWGQNQLGGNTAGSVANPGVQIGANVCNGSACP